MADNVKEKLESYQTGSLPKSEEPTVPDVNIDDTEKKPSLYRQLMSSSIPQSNTSVSTTEALEAGFGTSRYDREFVPGMDVEDARAKAQSAGWKIGNGLIKGGVTAATTAANTVAGSVVGLGSALYELGAEVLDPEKEVNVGKIVDAGVNNFLSEQLVKLQKLSEEWFPNYRTAEERSAQYQREWWKHMNTANFVGDTFLKNFGFTVGAMAGGAFAAKGLSKILAKGLANDLMKGVAVAAEGDAQVSAALQDALASIQKGTAMAVDTKKVLNNIKDAAKAINRYDAQMQLFGATIGAMGEGTVEGQFAKNEFLDDYNQRLEQNFKQEYDALFNELVSEGNSKFVKNRLEMHDGQIVPVPYLTQEGEAELARRQQDMLSRYNHLKEYASDQADRLASTTFLLNLPVLTASNTIQFGRMFSGGWKTSRNAAKVVGGVNATKEGIKGAYNAVKNKAARAVYNTAKVMGTESSEEMIQGTISSGTKQVALDRLAEYNNNGYDPEAVGQYASWFEGMLKGGSEYLTDAQNWQEGALGALTGLFGIPGRFWKGQWNGGIVEAIKSANQEIKASHEAADKLNALVNSEEFQTRWHNYIRHKKEDNEMEKALAEDNQYTWRSASDRQLIGDVMAFADYGKLNDLEEVVDHFGSMTLQDAPQLRDMLKNQEGQSDWTDKLSDQEVVNTVKERSEDVKKTIREYRDIYDNLSSRLPAGTSNDFLKEIVFTAQQLKKFDDRFLTIFGETMKAIEPKLRALAGVKENANDEESLRKIENVRNAYATLFAGEESILPKSIPAELTAAVDFDWLKQQVKDDSELLQKVEDMEHLRQDRQDYYSKFIYLRDNKNAQKTFEQQAITPEKMEEAADIEVTKEEMNTLSGMNDVRQKYLAKKNYREQLQFIQSLEGIEDINADAKAFLDLYHPYNDIRKYLDRKQAMNNAFDPRSMALNNLLDDLFREANSVDDILKVPDSIIERIRIKQAPTTEWAKDTFVQAVSDLKDAIAEYRRSENLTGNRKQISNINVEPKPEEEENPTGRDASNPASATPLPPVEDSPEEKEQLKQQEKEAKETKKPEDTEEVPPKEPTDVSRMDDSKDALGDQSVFEEEHVEGKPNTIVYIRTSVPEISTEEAVKARKAINNRDRKALEECDLSEFLVYLDHQIEYWKGRVDNAKTKKEKNDAQKQVDKFSKQRSGYDAVWRRLQSLGAFTYAAEELSVGEEIEFVIDPSDKDLFYDGKPMIMLRSAKTGQILTPLLTSEKYLGITALRNEIMKEYASWTTSPEHPVFVFSKKSTVYVKRPGLVQYNFGNEKTAAKDLAGYSPDTPIMFIGKDGVPTIVRGDKAAADKLMGDFASAQHNVDSNRVGSLYYLVRDGEEKFIPVRLDAARFTVDNMNNEGSTFNAIREQISAISSVLSDLNKDEDLGTPTKKILGHVAELRKYIYLGEYDFSVTDFNNVGRALRIHRVDGKGKDIFLRPDQVADNDKLLKTIAGLEPKIQVSQESNVDALISDGLIETNAVALRPRGVDFCAFPWNEKLGDFAPATPKQHTADTEIKQERGEELDAPAAEEPVVPAVTVEEVAPALPGWMTTNYVEGMEEPESAQQEADVDKPWSEQPEYMRKALEHQGITEEEFNSMSRDAKELAFHCAE